MGAKQTVIVRLTYHRLDEQNIFYAIEMCRALHSAGCEVVLMLDKEATRIANRELATQFIKRHEKKARSTREALESVLSDGVRVVVAKEWAIDYGLDEGNTVSGVEFLTTDQLAAEIVNSSKILEY